MEQLNDKKENGKGKNNKIGRQYCSESSKDMFIMAIKKDLIPCYPKRLKEEKEEKGSEENSGSLIYNFISNRTDFTHQRALYWH